MFADKLKQQNKSVIKSKLDTSYSYQFSTINDTVVHKVVDKKGKMSLKKDKKSADKEMSFNFDDVDFSEFGDLSINTITQKPDESYAFEEINNTVLANTKSKIAITPSSKNSRKTIEKSKSPVKKKKDFYKTMNDLNVKKKEKGQDNEVVRSEIDHENTRKKPKKRPESPDLSNSDVNKEFLKMLNKRR